MTSNLPSRRQFLANAGLLAGTTLASPSLRLFPNLIDSPQIASPASPQSEPVADYTLRIQSAPIEIAHNRIVSATTYNGQFPGPLLRFKEGRPVIIDVHNDTSTPEQLHWHGQMVSTDVDGAAEEGTPFVPSKPASARRRL